PREARLAERLDHVRPQIGAIRIEHRDAGVLVADQPEVVIRREPASNLLGVAGHHPVLVDRLLHPPSETHDLPPLHLDGFEGAGEVDHGISTGEVVAIRLAWLWTPWPCLSSTSVWRSSSAMSSGPRAWTTARCRVSTRGRDEVSSWSRRRREF